MQSFDHPVDAVFNLVVFYFFFFNDTATTEIYTLSLHDALPISASMARPRRSAAIWGASRKRCRSAARSEEHTSELQSRLHLVCRLLLEKKKTHIQPKSSTSIVFTLRPFLNTPPTYHCISCIISL